MGGTNSILCLVCWYILQCLNSRPATLRQSDVEFGQFKRLLKTVLFGGAAVH